MKTNEELKGVINENLRDINKMVEELLNKMEEVEREAFKKVTYAENRLEDMFKNGEVETFDVKNTFAMMNLQSEIDRKKAQVNAIKSAINTIYWATR